MRFLLSSKKRAAPPADVLHEADRFIREAKRRRLGAFWLDLLLAGGAVAVALAVWDAMRVPNDAIVVVNEIRKGESLRAADVVFAPLRVSPRNVRKGAALDQLVAARNLAPGSLLRRRDVAPRRPRAAAGELELPLRIFVGRTPPSVGEQVLLGVVGVQRGDSLVVTGRVLAVDPSVDPAYVTVATSERHALALAAIPQPQIQLMHRPQKERKR